MVSLNDMTHPEFSTGTIVRIDEKAIDVTMTRIFIRKNIGAIAFDNNTETNVLLTFNKVSEVDKLIDDLETMKHQMLLQQELVYRPEENKHEFE